MRNAIYPAPYWRNKSISSIPPSDDGPYLTAMWIVLLRPAWVTPYFTMVAVITWNYLCVSVIPVRIYFKGWGIFDLRAFHDLSFCMPPDRMEVSQVSDFVLMYFTCSRLFPSGDRYIPNISVASSDFRSLRRTIMTSLVFAVNYF